MVAIRVLLFASYADALGREASDLRLPAGARVRDVVEHLRRLPGAGALPPAPLTAVNEAYAGPDTVLVDGDEVAIIPPVAGG